MTKYNFIRKATHGELESATWSVSNPNRWGQVKLQVTCQGVVLESDYVNIEHAKEAKHSIERMLKEILFTKNQPVIIRRKEA